MHSECGLALRMWPFCAFRIRSGTSYVAVLATTWAVPGPVLQLPLQITHFPALVNHVVVLSFVLVSFRHADHEISIGLPLPPAPFHKPVQIF